MDSGELAGLARALPNASWLPASGLKLSSNTRAPPSSTDTGIRTNLVRTKLVSSLASPKSCDHEQALLSRLSHPSMGRRHPPGAAIRNEEHDARGALGGLAVVLVTLCPKGLPPLVPLGNPFPEAFPPPGLPQQPTSPSPAGEETRAGQMAC